MGGAGKSKLLASAPPSTFRDTDSQFSTCDKNSPSAALFIATGQDAAQVVEASMGMSIAESTDSGLYFSVRIPSLEVGTVGGGTGLPTQREALEIMGCSGSGKSPKFAEIAAALILAGELSTLAAQSRGELAAAHSSLAR